MKRLLSLVAVLALQPTVSRATAKGQNFDRVVTVIFENTDYGQAMHQSFFGKLANEGVNFSDFTAETHPSQANYIALTSGSENGVRGDGTVDVDSTNIVDLLEAKGLTWKVYAEAYPGNCYTGTKQRNYVRKHNPFISYLNIQQDAARCAHIVDASEFDKDLASGRLPNYVFYIPDLKNDGHDTGVNYADHWYGQRFGPLLTNSSFMTNTLLITTFDESGSGAGNHTYASFYGPMVKGGLSVSDSINHYSILRLIEDNWSLGSLGREDQSAALIPNIWK